MKVNDLIVAVFIALGVVSALDKLDIPYWVYLALGGVYVVFRLTGTSDKKFSALSGHVGNHPPDPPPGSGGGNG